MVTLKTVFNTLNELKINRDNETMSNNIAITFLLLTYLKIMFHFYIF